MLNLIKKDFLMISRDRSEIILLLIMPSVLIVILGFALGGMLSNNTTINAIPVAFVNENNTTEDLEQFASELRYSGVSENVIQSLIQQAQKIDPANMFEGMLDTLVTSNILDVKTGMTPTEAQNALQNDEISAVLTLPKSFTLDALRAVFQENDSQSTVEIVVADKDSVSASVLNSVVTRFTSEFNLQASILSATGGVNVEVNLPDNFGEVTHLPLLKSVTSFQYYTLGMSMMFSLYIASSVSSNAFKEKTNHTFSRLMATGEKPIRYLLSKAIAGGLLCITQLTILFTTSTLLFGTFRGLSIASYQGIFISTLILAITIGSLSALLTSIAQRFNTDSVSGIFSTFIISAFSFLGGSMIPMQSFSSTLRSIGSWTPNGAMMNVYLQLVRGQTFDDVTGLLLRMGIMSCAFIVLALLVFPRRRLV